MYKEIPDKRIEEGLIALFTMYKAACMLCTKPLTKNAKLMYDHGEMYIIFCGEACFNLYILKEEL